MQQSRCSGIIFKNEAPKSNILESELILSNQDIIDIMKVTETEVIKFKNENNFKQQAAGVVDTILDLFHKGFVAQRFHNYMILKVLIIF